MADLSDSSWLLREAREIRMCSALFIYVPRTGTCASSAERA